MTAAIYVHNGVNSEVYAEELTDKDDIIDGEVYAIDMALSYINKHFLKEVIIYTEIPYLIHAHIFTVVLNIRNIKDLPSEHRNVAYRHKDMWSHFRYAYSKNKRIVLDEVKSNKNPAHAVAREKVEEIKRKKNQKLSWWKRKIISICKYIISSLENDS